MEVRPALNTIRGWSVKYSSSYRWLIVTALLCLVGSLSLAGSVSAQDPTVSISPASQTVNGGEVFTADVYVVPEEAIAGVQFNLSFDSSLITADSVTEGNLLNQGSCSTFFQPGTIDNGAGTITGVAGAITTPGCTVSNPGIFATITFTAREIAGSSALNLSNVIVGDINGQPVDITVNDGSVLVWPNPWDVNDDGYVNVLDMILAGQSWGFTGALGWIPEDVNADGAISVLDMILIGQHWGEVYGG